MANKYILQRLCSITQKYHNTTPILNQMIIRQSSYGGSKLVDDIKDLRKFEISKSPEEWKYVERLLPKPVVPEPIRKQEYPSNWKPEDLPKDMKYFIRRTRNHMLPVYLKSTHRGMRKLTLVRKVQGDIFLLRDELKQYLENMENRNIALQVNEFVGYIHIKGDHVNSVKEYLLRKGY